MTTASTASTASTPHRSVAPRMLERPVEGPMAWTGPDVGPRDCIVPLGPAAREAARALARVPAAPAGPKLPDALVATMREVKRRLTAGPGIAVVDALPLDEMESEQAIAVLWRLAPLVGRPVPQTFAGPQTGRLLYDVRDSGRAYGYGVRGSRTNVELVFHTDNAFGRSPPRYVGLLCLRPARSGGASRFASLYTVHNRMLATHPRALARLYRPVLWDRQKEHVDGGPAFMRAPVFSFDGTALFTRANLKLIRQGYALAGEALDAETEEALSALASVTADPDLWFELPLERGQIQYLNNSEIAHYRSEFEDHADPARKRHLVRTWHRDDGAPTYDG